jgi:hypothetical protein
MLCSFDDIIISLEQRAISFAKIIVYGLDRVPVHSVCIDVQIYVFFKALD